MDDEQNQRWLDRLRGPEPERGEAIEELRKQLLVGLSRSLGSRYGGAVQAEDIVQEALLRILDSLNSFQGRCRFLTWAMTVATRVGIGAARRKYFRDVSLDSLRQSDALQFELAVAPIASVEAAQDRDALVCQLKEIVDRQLTEKQRIAIQGVLDELPVEIIADRVGSNRNAVYKLVHDARLKLRDALEQSGITAEVFRSAFA